MKTRLIICCVLAILQTTSNAQSKTEVLSNKLVVDMYKGGLSTQTILAKIASATCDFDLRTSSLLGLKKAGLPATLIEAMVNTEATPRAAVSNQPLPPAKPVAVAKTPGIDLLNHVYAVDDAVTTPLEKSLATTKTKMKALGYGGTDLVLEIDGATSENQFKADHPATFLIKTDSEAPPDLVLYKLKVGKKSRQAVTGKYNLGGMQGSQGGLTVNIGKMDTGVFKISFSKPLEKGEYFFQSRAMTNQSTNAEVFPFTVI